MTVEYLAPGIKCDLKCKYCYQESMRDAGNITVPTNWEAVRTTLGNLGQEFTVFGGEVLLTPKKHLEEVFAFGLERFGRNGIQTNGLRLDDDHIRMFQQYKVSVGLSIDGPWPLNSPRSTREETEKIINNIVKLCNAGIMPSVIITVHRENASRIDEFIKFINWLEAAGIVHINFHELEVDDDYTMQNLNLTNEENFETFSKLYQVMREKKMPCAPFSDIRAMLTGEGGANCVWRACDPLTTPAVQGVNPDGSMSNCGRAVKDGVNWLKTDTHGKERYQALYRTPQEHGGCKDCRFFFVCKGQCPGTSIDGDWRNKTVNCLFWYALIELIEKDLIARGIKILDKEQIKYAEQEITYTSEQISHGDVPHGDIPHTNTHGDHTDRIYNIQELVNDSKTRLSSR